MAQPVQLSEALIQRMDVPGPRYTSYPTVPSWSSSLSENEYLEALGLLEKSDHELGVYIHIPFCERRCAFCGCNVLVSRDHTKADRYLDYLQKEINLTVKSFKKKRVIQQLHLGGGTPTFLRENQLLRLYGLLISHFDISAEAEVSIEADPTVTNLGQIELLARIGFNRISFGVQDFDPKVQSEIHRRQSFEETRLLVEHARKTDFKSINFDLIYGLPGQTPQSWNKTLDQVLELRPDRLAVFGFAYLPILRTNQKRLQVAKMPVGVDKHRLFKIAYDKLLDAGYISIGMDHFALACDELAKAHTEKRLRRNFQGYSALAPADTLAFGLSSISDVSGCLVQNTPKLKTYEEYLDTDQLPIARGLVRSQEDRERENIIQSIMCNAWVNLGPNAQDKYAREYAELEQFVDLGLMRFEGSSIVLTQMGTLFVRNIAMVFDRYLRTQDHTFSRTV